MKKESNNTQLSYEEETNILLYLTSIYRKAKVVTDLYEKEGKRALDTDAYRHQVQMIELIDRTLMECTPKYRFIIQHAFIEREPNDWFMPYYSRSSYYRQKKEAVHEFNQVIQSLND